MRSRYELFDHTADAGMRVFAPSLAELVQPAGQGLYAVIGELVGAGEATTVQLSFSGAESAVLLRDYLAELLRLFEMERRVVTAVDVEEFSTARLAVAAETRRVDDRRSVYEREVKAVTYHQLAIRPVPGGYQATFIVDI